MREISIEGTYIGNAIGYCHCESHKGALNRQLAYKHKCIGKRCKYLEKYDEDSWKNKRIHYYNKRSKSNGKRN